METKTKKTVSTYQYHKGMVADINVNDKAFKNQTIKNIEKDYDSKKLTAAQFDALMEKAVYASPVTARSAKPRTPKLKQPKPRTVKPKPVKLGKVRKARGGYTRRR